MEASAEGLCERDAQHYHTKRRVWKPSAGNPADDPEIVEESRDNTGQYRGGGVLCDDEGGDRYVVGRGYGG